MESVITPALRARLEQLRDDGDGDLPRRRSPAPAPGSPSASELMPNGVPVSWMSGFWRHSPVVAVSGSGHAPSPTSTATRYRDFNLCDLAMAAGFAPPPIVEAITAPGGAGQPLPAADHRRARGEPAAARSGSVCPRWQYTLSASGANVDALRLARAFTGRQKVVVFQAKYHGHMDEMLWSEDEPDGLGLPEGSGAHLIAVPFNDLAALEAALAGDDVAAVLLEPVMTNCGLVHAAAGFPRGLRSRHPSARDARHRRRHPHPVRRPRWWCTGVRPRPGHHHRRQGDRWRDARRRLRHDRGCSLTSSPTTSRVTSPTIRASRPAAPCTPTPCRWRPPELDSPRSSPPRRTDRVDELGARLQQGLQQLVDASGSGLHHRPLGRTRASGA